MMLKKESLYPKLVRGFQQTTTRLPEELKINRIKTMDSWNVIKGDDLRIIIESSGITDNGKLEIFQISNKVNAFKLDSNVAVLDEPPF